MTTGSVKISPSTRVSRDSSLLFSEIDNEIVILSVINEEYYYLNSIGSVIWKQIIEPKSIGDIVNYLTELYEVSAEVCLSETTEYLAEIFALGIINLSNE